MEISCVQCDRCKMPMNGSGFYLSHEKCEGGIRMAIIKSQHNPPGDWMNHYCGKACLMLALNEVMDEVNAPSIILAEEEIQKELERAGLNPTPTDSGMTNKEEEDYYEDNLGI